MDERLNGKIQEIKTVTKGYRNIVNFRSAILFFMGVYIFTHQNNGRTIILDRNSIKFRLIYYFCIDNLYFADYLCKIRQYGFTY